MKPPVARGIYCTRYVWRGETDAFKRSVPCLQIGELHEATCKGKGKQFDLGKDCFFFLLVSFFLSSLFFSFCVLMHHTKQCLAVSKPLRHP